MEIVHRSCAGIDIGKRSVKVCVITSGPRSVPQKEIRTFGMLTRDLLALADWPDDVGVEAAAMEATGSYWKPLWNLLEERFELLLANAAHLKAVPGRKTDVRDAEWIAELFRHGLLRASFIPPRPERELCAADELIERLVTIPGVGRRTAEVVLAEIGTDMTRFHSARQLAPWAGMCPGKHESAGTHHGGATRRGSPWLRGALVSCARSAARTKTYLGAQYHRLAARRGARRALWPSATRSLGSSISC